ncbi:DUF3298 and DUF4163 domain-containing protein [Mucilaginibacter xinganensis]|uniref:DUF3298 domain-containing protein n=1 Tax=Mucilaginibacter xinganensis TaxID=1234841 RepID=A0A223NWR6_9SPHI|nr:DUF3298 and DUF4163 domain-containing protein [Mucilaginibacter xinganensis]ASU34038.1 hypothetical protein MuYL_2148 [Mucilaginibacter xinganensis]
MRTGYLAICLLTVLISSCMWGKPGKKVPDINRDTLAYKYTAFKQRAADCGNKADSDCTVAKFNYPDFKGQKALNDTIAGKLLNMFQLGEKPDTSLATLTKNFMTDYISSKRGDGSSMFYALDVNVKVLRQDSSLTTLETNGYVFTGGAHPSSYTGFINWNTKADKSITLTDLFTPGNISKLEAVAERIFRKNEKLSDTASLADNYFFKDNKFALNSNFSVTPTGLRFLYNQYEIKPYAAGTTELVIPYTQIKSLLRPNSVVAQYIK